MSLQSRKDIPSYNSGSPSFQCDLERLLFPPPNLKTLMEKKSPLNIKMSLLVLLVILTTMVKIYCYSTLL